jgi:hypothetical protein
LMKNVRSDFGDLPGVPSPGRRPSMSPGGSPGALRERNAGRPNDPAPPSTRISYSVLDALGAISEVPPRRVDGGRLTA